MAAASSAPQGRLLLCDCEGTQTIDAAKLRSGCQIHSNLCRRQIDIAAAALSSGEAVTIACAQETATFEDLAAELQETQAEDGGGIGPLACVDIRDRAGWSDEGAAAGPKMAALLAEAAMAAPDTPTVPISSAGVCLVYGAGQQALEAAQRLSDTLSVTAMLTEAATPCRRAGAIFQWWRAASPAPRGGSAGLS